ncbi:MAG: hypothetical protein WD295_04345, partial [Bacteroidota bacterium]
MSKTLSLLLDNQKDFLKFLKERYLLFHESNLFFRDIHYGVMAFLAMHDRSAGYSDAESVAREFVHALEKQNILIPLDARTWMLNYPEFKKPPVKP